MEINNSLGQLAIQSLTFTIIGVLVYALSRILRFRHLGYSFANPKASGLWGITAVLAGWILVSALFVLAVSFQGAQQTSNNESVTNANQVVSQLIIALIQLGPVLVIMRWRREPLASAGVSRHNFGRALAVGLLLGMLPITEALFTGNRGLSGMVAGLTASHFWALLKYAIVGISEEFTFRGFLQTRMIAWLGRWQGWLVTSVLMALAHIIQRITIMGLPSGDALLSSALLIPISLLMGYIMIRTENVIAPALFHTFANWVNTLG